MNDWNPSDYDITSFNYINKNKRQKIKYKELVVVRSGHGRLQAGRLEEVMWPHEELETHFTSHSLLLDEFTSKRRCKR